MKGTILRWGVVFSFLGLLYVFASMAFPKVEIPVLRRSTYGWANQQSRLVGVWRLCSRTVRSTSESPDPLSFPIQPDLEVFAPNGSWYTRPDHADSAKVRLASGDWSLDRQTLSILVSDGDVIQYSINTLTRDSLTRTWTRSVSDATATVTEKFVCIRP